MPKIEELLLEREQTYGEAWSITGGVVSFLEHRCEGCLYQIITSGYFYAWIIILCKLIRLLTTPTHADSWKDIEGYAHLVCEHISCQNT